MDEAHGRAGVVPGVVRVRQRLQHLVGDEESDLEGETPPALLLVPLHHAGQVAPDDVLLGHEVLGARHAEVEHRNDVRVHQARLQAGLVDELGDRVFFARQLRTQALEHERAAESLDTARLGDEQLRHATLAEPVDQAVAAQHRHRAGRAGRRNHGRNGHPAAFAHRHQRRARRVVLPRRRGRGRRHGHGRIEPRGNDRLGRRSVGGGSSRPARAAPEDDQRDAGEHDHARHRELQRTDWQARRGGRDARHGNGDGRRLAPEHDDRRVIGLDRQAGGRQQIRPAADADLGGRGGLPARQLHDRFVQCSDARADLRHAAGGDDVAVDDQAHERELRAVRPPPLLVVEQVVPGLGVHVHPDRGGERLDRRRLARAVLDRAQLIGLVCLPLGVKVDDRVRLDAGTIPGRETERNGAERHS